jgi:pimeloyl-ACP methyl ester carboxylesterase
VTAWLNTPIQTRFRTIDGLSIRYAESPHQRSDHALLLSPWPERLLEHPHVVGPDVGNGASLFAAALHPGRLRSLVVGSGGTARVANTLGARKTSAGRRRRTGGPGVQRAVRGRARNREEERTQMPSRASDRRR